MKINHLIQSTNWQRSLTFSLLCLIPILSFSQINPPGYERELQMRAAEKVLSPMERDSITIIDTVAIFNPETYEETIQVITATYSLAEYCKTFLGMNNPDILLDGKPHTIVDPRTYEDMIIRLNPGGKIDTIPK